jgi:hypothetical protein
MKRHGSAGIIAALVLASVAIGVQPATAALDNNPPKLTVALKPAFVVGSVISAAAPFDIDPENGYTFSIAQSIHWSATDDVGVCNFDLYRVYAGLPPEFVFEYSQQASYTDTADDYDGTFGGGSLELEGWYVTARDCAGNAITKQVYMAPTVTQEDNANAEHPTAGTIRYAGTWTSSHCTCHSAGDTRHTTDDGARATFTRTYEKGDHVAVVMPEGPNRGRAAILLDGKQVAVVDTFAQVNTNRVVMFERRMPVGVHKLTIENLASSERPRIDLDAIITN